MDIVIHRHLIAFFVVERFLEDEFAVVCLPIQVFFKLDRNLLDLFAHLEVGRVIILSDVAHVDYLGRDKLRAVELCPQVGLVIAPGHIQADSDAR